MRKNYETNCVLKRNKRRVYTMFKIFRTYIRRIGIQNVKKTGTKWVRIMKQTEF
jgi:hypothetical protein